MRCFHPQDLAVSRLNARRVMPGVRPLQMMPAPPTFEEFKSVCREAFGFVAAHGFRDVPPQRTPNAFQVWFCRGDEFIIVQGEGHGAVASAHLEHVSGVELPIIYLVPPEARPPKWKRGMPQPSQLEQVRRESSWLRLHGEDFLRGDLQRFFSLAKQLPPWKERLSNEG